MAIIGTKALCERCGKEFIRHSGLHRFCSKACREGVPYPAHISRPCMHCGTMIEDPLPGQKYCCDKCRKKATSKRKSESCKKTAEAPEPETNESCLQKRDRKIFDLCRETGLSYGKVVAKFGL